MFGGVRCFVEDLGVLVKTRCRTALILIDMDSGCKKGRSFVVVDILFNLKWGLGMFRGLFNTFSACLPNKLKVQKVVSDASVWSIFFCQYLALLISNSIILLTRELSPVRQRLPVNSSTDPLIWQSVYWHITRVTLYILHSRVYIWYVTLVKSYS